MYDMILWSIQQGGQPALADITIFNEIKFYLALLLTETQYDLKSEF